MRPTSGAPVDQQADMLADMLRRVQAIEKVGHVHERFGFAVRRAVNEAARGTLQSFQIAFDTCVHNNGFLGAVTPGAITPQASFVVPAHGAGVYQLNAGAWWNANLTGIGVTVTVNGTAVCGSPILGAGTAASAEVGRAWRLDDGDTITATVYNGSPGNITVTTFAGSAFTAPLPYLSVWRV